jgi:hypothetical protein
MRAVRHLVFAIWWLSLGLCGSAAYAADGAPSHLGSAERAVIQQVIKQQLEAFHRDDDGAAFAMAAPSIQTIFGDPENFMVMVKNGFQPLYRTREFSFEPLLEIGGRIVQQMRVVGADGIAHLALYTMEQQADGRWLIAGCVLLDLPEQGV